MEKEDFETLKLRYLELTSLFETNKVLNASLDLQTILDNLLLTSMGRLMISKGLVLLRQKKNILKVAAVKGISRQNIGRVFGLETEIHSPGFVSELIGADTSLGSFLRSMEAKLILPLISNEKMLGLVVFGRKFVRSDYHPDEIDFLQSLVSGAALAVDKSLLFDELKATNRELDKKIQELNTVLEISRELNATLEPQKIANILSFAIMGELLVKECLIVLFENEQVQIVVKKGMEIENDRLTRFFSQPTCRQKLLSGPFVRLSEAACEEAFSPQIFAETKLELLVPLISNESLKGFIGIGRKITGGDFSKTELGFLETLANDAIGAVENARMVRQLLEKERLEEELKIARDIQKRLLPEGCPRVSGFEIAAVNHSCRQVGGDYYDCISLGKGRLGLAIADVSGKSTPAALLMANLQASLRTLAGEGLPVHQLVERINDIIFQNTTSDKFITFFYGELLADEGRLLYTNAGHNPPILLRSDGTTELLEAGGLILGILKNQSYRQKSVEFHPNDVLVLYTDGITEALNDREEEFGEDRLMRVIRKNRSSRAEELAATILAEVERFSGGKEQSDDITLLIVKAGTEREKEG